MAGGERERAANVTANNTSADQIEGVNAVAKLAALGTHLANLRGDAVRQRYTDLSLQVEKIVREAKATPLTDLNKVFRAG